MKEEQMTLENQIDYGAGLRVFAKYAEHVSRNLNVSIEEACRLLGRTYQYYMESKQFLEREQKAALEQAKIKWKKQRRIEATEQAMHEMVAEFALRFHEKFGEAHIRIMIEPKAEKKNWWKRKEIVNEN